MYTPANFAQHDPATLQQFIERYSFATLISQQGNEPLASHLPLLLDRSSEPGRLVGHMARANPQWQHAVGQQVLAIFAGPHAYISPTWYASENVVPTWNYVAVHVYGTMRLEPDRHRTLELIRRTVNIYEAGMPQPWSLESQDSDFIDRLLNAIVAFEISIERIEGKWKLNQNHTAQRRQQVAEGLQSTGMPDARAIAELMRANLSS